MGILLLFVTAAGYFFQRFQTGKWWSNEYLLSLMVPISIFIVFTWFAFVPRRLEYSTSRITLSTLVGTYTYDWSDLDCYGFGRGVFKLKFQQDRQPFQISGAAYSKKDWSSFTDFLNTQFPERKSSFSIGTRMFRDR